jgi:PIN domain nuclease of toxin-antitoxin system
MTSAAVSGWLLDTHALLWMLYDDRRLSRAARGLIEGETPLYYSTASFWEIALKRTAKGFDFEIEEDWDLLLPRELSEGGVLRIDLEAADCREVENLPLVHRDPFDRLLLAQARRRRLGLISRDEAFDRYELARAW